MCSDVVGVLPRWQVGEVSIACVVDAEPVEPLTSMFPAATAAAVEPGADWLVPDFLDGDGNLLMSVNTYLVGWRDRRIVVDTCIGGGKQRSYPLPPRPGHDYPGDLTRAGFAPDAVDTVVCTHLHYDHIGWNTVQRDGRWVPTFPNARYLLGRADWEYWDARRRGGEPPVFDSDVAMADSIDPLVAAGLVDLVEPPHQLAGPVSLLAAPGHTPGHVSIWIDSGGETAAITGDLIHSPVQVMHPDWASGSDVDADRATLTRRAFLARCADAGTLVLGTHFHSPMAGRVVADGDGGWRLATVPGGG